MKKKARQSSTARGSAANAVDGVLASKTVSQCTATDVNLDGNMTRWWSVDLQSLHAILYVNITSRADCCGQWTSFEKFQSGIFSVARAEFSKISVLDPGSRAANFVNFKFWIFSVVRATNFRHFQSGSFSIARGANFQKIQSGIFSTAQQLDESVSRAKK